MSRKSLPGVKINIIIIKMNYNVLCVQNGVTALQT